MIKVDLNTKIKDINGVEQTQTIKDILTDILWNSRMNQGRASTIIKTMSKSDSIDFKAEDVDFIKKVMTDLNVRTGEFSQIIELLEPPVATVGIANPELVNPK